MTATTRSRPRPAANAFGSLVGTMYAAGAGILAAAAVFATASRTLQGTPTVVPPIISATRLPPPGMTWSQARAHAVPLATDDA